MNYNRGKLAISARIIFIRGCKVLLGLRGKTTYASGKWMLPGGTTDRYETVRASAIREAYEELGIIVKEEQLEFIGVAHWYQKEGDIDGIVCNWACYDWISENNEENEPENREPDKCYQLTWLTLEEIEDLAKKGLMASNSYSILKEFMQGKQSLYIENDWPENGF